MTANKLSWSTKLTSTVTLKCSSSLSTKTVTSKMSNLQIKHLLGDKHGFYFSIRWLDDCWVSAAEQWASNLSTNFTGYASKYCSAIWARSSRVYGFLSLKNKAISLQHNLYCSEPRASLNYQNLDQHVTYLPNVLNRKCVWL